MGDVSVVLRVQTKKDIGKLEKFVSLGNMISHFCFSPSLCFYPLIHTSRLSALLEMFFFSYSFVEPCSAWHTEPTSIYRKLCVTSCPFSAVILLEIVWKALTEDVLSKMKVLLRKTLYNECLIVVYLMIALKDTGSWIQSIIWTN